MAQRSSDIGNAANLLVLAHRLGYNVRAHKNGVDIVLSNTGNTNVNTDQQADVVQRIRHHKAVVLEFMNDKAAVKNLISGLDEKRTWLSTEISSTDHWIGRLHAAYGLVWPAHSEES